jgi:hypothetical protein
MRDDTPSSDNHVVTNGDTLENDCTHANKDVIPDAHSTSRAKHPAITTLEHAPVVAMREDGHTFSYLDIVANLYHPGSGCVDDAVSWRVDYSIITDDHTQRS